MCSMPKAACSAMYSYGGRGSQVAATTAATLAILSAYDLERLLVSSVGVGCPGAVVVSNTTTHIGRCGLSSQGLL